MSEEPLRAFPRPGNSGARVGVLVLLGNALQLFISFPWWSVVLKPVRTTGLSGWRLHDRYRCSLASLPTENDLVSSIVIRRFPVHRRLC